MGRESLDRVVRLLGDRDVELLWLVGNHNHTSRVCLVIPTSRVLSRPAIDTSHGRPALRRTVPGFPRTAGRGRSIIFGRTRRHLVEAEEITPEQVAPSRLDRRTCA